ncbi:MAG: class I tRNA ligase family protein, partial [Candidatus Rokubacteria bacterium]|nr:class I tRNA ligase family protein [Candidatus Rokubacteria bacterium]
NFAGGVVPAPGAETVQEAEVKAALDKARGEVDAAMEEFAFQRALIAIWEFIGAANRYVDATAPWALAKDPAKRERLGTVLYTLAETLRCLSILLEAFLPSTAERIRVVLGLSGTPVALLDLTWGRLTPGTGIQKAPALFPRIESASPLPRAGRGQGEGAKVGAQRITLDDFGKVDLRVAEVVTAEKVPKSKRLLKLTVRVGAETRTLVAGIAEHYEPATLVLEPATLMGVESNGMVLAASEGSDLALVVLDRDLPSGARVK